MKSEPMMSSQPVKTPRPRRLLIVGTIGLLAAGAIAANGLISRARSKQDLVQWTNAQAIPTVAIAQIARGDAGQSLILPGNIQPYNKAAIYARVNGYLKSWNKDIGAQVKAGDVLATIDAPDLDQQFGQAKATQAPHYEADVNWPKPLPDRWVTGGLGGVCVDAQDHVLILNRQDIVEGELNAGRLAPPLIELDPAGKVVNSWGDPQLLDRTIKDPRAPPPPS